MFQNIVSVSVKGKKDHGYPGAMVKDGGRIWNSVLTKELKKQSTFTRAISLFRVDYLQKNPWAESPREWNKECGVEAVIGPQSPAQQ